MSRGTAAERRVLGDCLAQPRPLRALRVYSWCVSPNFRAQDVPLGLGRKGVD